MWLKNQFSLEPGEYHHRGTDVIIVVTELTTHEYVDSDQKERKEPLVTFRDLMPKGEKYKTYSMNLSDFNEKFVRA
jgi:hypothetical protein